MGSPWEAHVKSVPWLYLTTEKLMQRTRMPRLCTRIHGVRLWQSWYDTLVRHPGTRHTWGDTTVMLLDDPLVARGETLLVLV